MAKEPEIDDLVGDGKLVAYPNDVVVGKGSKWIHPRPAQHKYAIFGQRYTRHKIGLYGSGRCVLMLPVDWWDERQSEWLASDHRDSLALDVVEIAYPIKANKGKYLWVYAGKFMATKQTDMPAFRNTKLDGSGHLLVDRAKDMHFEFSSIGREVEAHGPNPQYGEGAMVE